MGRDKQKSYVLPAIIDPEYLGNKRCPKTKMGWNEGPREHLKHFSLCSAERKILSKQSLQAETNLIS